VGINSLIFSTSEAFMGVSFAVPIDTAIKIVAELRAAGRVSRGHLGAMVQELTPELARAFGVGASSGALVTRIVHGSPAERGGLRSGDILRGIGGHVDQSYETIEKEVTGARPGEEITLDVWRRGASLRLVAVLDEAPADLPPKPSPISFRVDERLGLNLGEIRTARRVDLGIGVAVLEAHGAAARAGLLPNDVIVAVADRAVHTIAEFDAALALIPVDRPVALLVERGGVWGFVAVENGR
jgi:serine protease Do